MDRSEGEEEEAKTRIFVGGLGEKATSDDVIKIFSSLGAVKGVDIVRTKGRSFAYVDFYPSSNKSLPKLFSTYNGCVWKGGRLRLEKAKEHYIARLKREWAEDSEPVCPWVSDSVDSHEDVAPLKKPGKGRDSEKKLQIFFPRLRKVKAVPYSGTGKHKYSFQRIEALSVPKYFCDCEEHSVPSDAERKQICHHTAEEEEIHDLEAQSGVINDEELNMMNSVMNKLFARENVPHIAHGGTGMANYGHNSVKLVDECQIVENEVDSVTEEDDFVINVVSRGNSKMTLSGCQEKTTISPHKKKLTFAEEHTSKDGPSQSVPREQKKNNLPPNKKRKLLNNDEIIGNECTVANSREDVNSQTITKRSEKLLGTQDAEAVSGVRKTITSHSWSQKLSWKALVGDKYSCVFSVSNIIPADAFSKEANNDTESIEELKCNENESDEDDLVINVVSKNDKKIALSTSQEQKTVSSTNQRSTSRENTSSQDRQIQQKESTPAPRKKRKSFLKEESDMNKLVHTIPEPDVNVQTLRNEMGMPTGAQPIELVSVVKESITDNLLSQKSSSGLLVGDRGNDESSVSNITSDNTAKKEQLVDGPDVPGSVDGKNLNIARNENLESKLAEMETAELIAGAQPTKTTEAPNKSCSGSSWFQKSSWTQLVSENESSFSITQISPGITFKKHEVSQLHVGKYIANPADKNFSGLGRQAKIEPTGSGSIFVEGGKGFAQDIPEKNEPIIVGDDEGDNEASASMIKNKPIIVGDDEGDNEASASMIKNKRKSVETKTNGYVTIGETCSFMRSAASIKEWAKVKAALSGSQSHKGKSNGK